MISDKINLKYLFSVHWCCGRDIHSPSTVPNSKFVLNMVVIPLSESGRNVKTPCDRALVDPVEGRSNFSLSGLTRSSSVVAVTTKFSQAARGILDMAMVQEMVVPSRDDSFESGFFVCRCKREYSFDRVTV